MHQFLWEEDTIQIEVEENEKPEEAASFIVKSEYYKNLNEALFNDCDDAIGEEIQK